MQELIRVIDLALAGNWEQAHKIVQNIEDKTSYWISVRTDLEAKEIVPHVGIPERN